MEDSLNVDSFDKSLLFSISLTMEGSLVIARKFVSPNVHSNFRSYHKLVHRKGRSPKYKKLPRAFQNGG